MIHFPPRLQPSPRVSDPKSAFTLTVLIVMGAMLCSTPTARSQSKRDHLTPSESEVVQNNQELDKRIGVFVKAIERRFAVINGVTMIIPKKKSKEGEEEDWGDAPKGTRAELLGDIAGLLDEAITNIDNVSLRDPKNPLLGRSVHKLAGAARGFVAQLEALRSQAKDADELAAIQRALEDSQEIMEAAKNAPPPVENSNVKKKP